VRRRRGSAACGRLPRRHARSTSPFALVLVAGLGVASSTASESPIAAAKSLGRRSQIGAYRLVWLDVRAAVPRPTLLATARLLGLLLACFVLAGLAAAARGRSFPAGLVVSLVLIAPMELSKQGTYGTLGIAAALLLALYVISRLIVGAAVVNATLWERRTRSGRRESHSVAP